MMDLCYFLHIWLTPESWGSKCDTRVEVSRWLNYKCKECFTYFNYHTSTKSHLFTLKSIKFLYVFCCSAVKAKITMLHEHHSHYQCIHGDKCINMSDFDTHTPSASWVLPLSNRIESILVYQVIRFVP